MKLPALLHYIVWEIVNVYGSGESTADLHLLILRQRLANELDSGMFEDLVWLRMLFSKPYLVGTAPIKVFSELGGVVAMIPFAELAKSSVSRASGLRNASKMAMNTICRWATFHNEGKR